MWPGMPGRARRAGACSPPARPSCRLGSLPRGGQALASWLQEAPCISSWSMHADPRWPRALFLPRTPAALHSTPHSVGPPLSLTPRFWGRRREDPRAGRRTQQKGARAQKGRGARAARHRGLGVTRGSPSHPPAPGGSGEPPASSPRERPRSGGSEKATWAGAVLSDGDSCAPPPEAIPVLAGVREGGSRAFRHPGGQHGISR